MAKVTHSRVIVKLNLGMLATARECATLSRMSVEKFIEEIVEAELASRRCKALQPSDNEPGEPRPTPRRRDVLPDDLSGPEMGRYCFHLP